MLTAKKKNVSHYGGNPFVRMQDLSCPTPWMVRERSVTDDNLVMTFLCDVFLVIAFPFL